jgi:regulator of protease activity HflC (stomatin/prohibitin superfamily)
MAQYWGVYTTGVDIKIIELPEVAQEQMLRWWKAEWDRRVAEVQAEVARKGIEERGKGEAAAIAAIAHAGTQERLLLVESLSAAIEAAVPGMTEQDLELTERFMRAMEAFARAVDATDTATAVRYVEALEEMATESGTKVLVIGDEKRLLPEWLGPKKED